MRLDILTLFPEVFAPLFASIPARAQASGLVKVELHNLRDWGRGRHRQVDDLPFGGGPGMVIQAEPLAAATPPAASLWPL
jgi:tRNA (guanine37-N1)-methyltransferase